MASNVRPPSAEPAEPRKQSNYPGFGRFKIKLSAVLTIKIILELSVIFGYPNALLDELRNATDAALGMIMSMEERGQIDPTDISPLLTALTEMGRHGTARQVEGWFEKYVSIDEEVAAIAAQLQAAANPVELASTVQVNVQAAATAAAAAMQAKVLAQTGIAVPSYYNPLAINPVQYAEQIKKRKMLWSKKEEAEETTEASSNKWEATKFESGSTQEKFRRLMGIKEGAGASGDKEGDPEAPQADLMDKLDREYQTARLQTHTQRGVGLGFASQMIVIPPTAPPAPLAESNPPTTSS